MLSTARDFDQAQRFATYEVRGTAEHGIGPFHCLQRDTRAFSDRDALPEVKTGKRVCDAAAILDVARLILVGLALRQYSFTGQERLQQQGRIDET